MPARWPMRRKVIVNTTDGKALEGILWAKTRSFLILRGFGSHPGPLLYEAGTVGHPIKGEVLVERPNVSFVQIEP